MPKAARISTSIPVSPAFESSDTTQFVTVALFSGIGLLIFAGRRHPRHSGRLVLSSSA
ncbi:hypothetical protein RX327_22675 [Bradyrhizobium sp. BEA-2-5]|uniref:hypothetical protein n=1 Tax=Bradyrhizobium TaxID=374 RepID=UPI000B1A6E8B|nr:MULTISPECIES: hypothetical protein [Bradyrhizobium]WOH78722.1 hypothetical protein RX327_22675 [Bradyrhizobium sp. BEA-2-5]